MTPPLLLLSPPELTHPPNTWTDSISEIPHTNSYLVATNKRNGCDRASSRTCTPCDETNCKAALGGSANLDLICIPCNCAIEYDTCALSYTTSGPKAVANVSASGNYYACPAAPPSYVNEKDCRLYEQSGGLGAGVIAAIVISCVFFAFLISSASVNNAAHDF